MRYFQVTAVTDYGPGSVRVTSGLSAEDEDDAAAIVRERLGPAIVGADLIVAEIPEPQERAVASAL